MKPGAPGQAGTWGTQDGSVPGWLRAAAWISLAVALAQAALEVFVLRPGYGVGDETAQISLLVGLDQGAPFAWHWAQGDLQRIGLWLWLRMTGDGLRALHVPGLGVLTLEVLLLWRLVRRWCSAEAAAWAVLADCLCAATWMRTRSILSYPWLPLELLLLACLAGAVRSRRGALLWGAAGALLLLDYEGAMAALPGLFAACLWQEKDLRRRWVPVFAGFAVVAAVLAAVQPGVLVHYVYLRVGVNWNGGPKHVLAACIHNLGQLLAGGRPLPYLGVDQWPAVAAWSLPLLALGAWTAWGSGSWGVLFWAVSAVLITQAATAPWGVPAQRLAAAWPALCLVAGVGGAEARRLCPRVPAAAWIALLFLGTAAEANAFYRHMAFHGLQVYGRAAELDLASRDARAAQAKGAAVCTALMEFRSGDAPFLVEPAAPRVPGAEAWVFLPPEFRVAAPSAGQALVYRSSFNAVPVLVLRASGAQARRFEAFESELRPLSQNGTAPEEAAWLASSQGASTDDWAYAAVLDRYLRRLWMGLPLDQGVLRFLAARPQVTPGPLGLMGRYLIGRDPAKAVAFLDLALRVDPLWAPALEDRVKALDAAGRAGDARAAAALRDAGLRAGAWRDYD